MANFVAHALGRPDVLSNSNVFFTSMSLPPLVKKAWERDVYIYIYHYHQTYSITNTSS